MRTAKPSLRITKWLKTTRLAGADIPLEAECTACADTQFQVPFSLRNHIEKPFHQPDRDRFYDSLRRAFDAHVKSAHSRKP